MHRSTHEDEEVRIEMESVSARNEGSDGLGVTLAFGAIGLVTLAGPSVVCVIRI